MAEFSDIIERPKFSKYVTHKQVNRFKLITINFLEKSKDGVAPEADDNYLLGICESCKADYLITGDEDLLILNEYQHTKIICKSRDIL